MAERDRYPVPVEAEKEADWRPTVYVVGGAVGAVLGLISAVLYVRSVEQTPGQKRPQPPAPGEAVGLGISLLGIVRTVTEWGSKK